MQVPPPSFGTVPELADRAHAPRPSRPHHPARSTLPRQSGCQPASNDLANLPDRDGATVPLNWHAILERTPTRPAPSGTVAPSRSTRNSRFSDGSRPGLLPQTGGYARRRQGGRIANAPPFQQTSNVPPRLPIQLFQIPVHPRRGRLPLTACGCVAASDTLNLSLCLVAILTALPLIASLLVTRPYSVRVNLTEPMPSSSWLNARVSSPQPKRETLDSQLGKQPHLESPRVQPASSDPHDHDPRPLILGRGPLASLALFNLPRPPLAKRCQVTPIRNLLFLSAICFHPKSRVRNAALAADASLCSNPRQRSQAPNTVFKDRIQAIPLPVSCLIASAQMYTVSCSPPRGGRVRPRSSDPKARELKHLMETEKKKRWAVFCRPACMLTEKHFRVFVSSSFFRGYLRMQ
ncbi:hypothetical protein GQ607_014330 [Colletotrichum asianum]|uniref:Uncharacterized protein n=1 Tax=Colletotrichum asianum TaxID=702518 RepID=A0A8H3ZJU2_9PEZI|nr:hypothetical protein GQ607_014330 [Colletotrichum asianum]